MDEDGEGETTLYFDAEDGTLRAEDGAEITFEMTDESSANASEEPESQQEGDEDGSRTPTDAPQSEESASAQRAPQTITSMSPSRSVESRARRPSLARRLSSATQRRVSPSISHVHKC